MIHEKDSFVLYTSYIRKMQRLSMEQRGTLFTAILAHEAGEDLPEMDDATEIAFDFIREDLDDNRKRYEEKCERNRKIATEREERKRTTTNDHERARTCTNATDNDSDNDNDTDKRLKDKEKGTTRAARPTLDEVRAYCAERKSSVDPDRFYDYYESQKWKKANGRPVSDWKACVRTWEGSEKKTKIQPVKQNRFSHEERHAYDFDALAGILSQPIGGVL